MLKSSKPSIKQLVYELISKITGYDAKELDDDKYLEADLGMDSIKMITLMNELMSLVPPDQMEEFTNKHPVSSILSMQSVGDIVEVFESWDMEASTDDQTGETHCAIEPEITTKKQPEYLEIVNSQYPFLTCYQTISTLTISSGVSIEGELNIPCLHDSWRELILRHPSLRVVFEKAPGTRSFKGYRQRLLDDFVLPDISIEDISHLGSSEQKDFLKKTYEENLNRKFDMFQWPLHRISVIRTDRENYFIVLSIIHLITDGLGNQQILRELLEIYSAKLVGKKVDLPKAISSLEYNNLVNEINSWNSAQENSEFESYLKEQGKEKYFYNPYGEHKKLTISEPFEPIKTKVKKFWVPEGVTEKLVSNTKVWRVSLFVLVVSAYLRTIKQLNDNEDKIILNLPTGGKVYPNADATGVLGSFAQNMALSFSAGSPYEAWDDLIEKVNIEIKSKLSSGLDRAQTLKAAHAARENELLTDGKMNEAVGKVIRASVKSNLYLSFVGNTNIKKSYEGLKIKDYEAYTCTNPGTIDILVEVLHNKLLFTANYDSTFFDEAYIDRHMNKLIHNINGLVEVCAAHKNLKKVTSSVTIGKDAQEDILKKVDEICHRRLTEADLDRDIDSEIGMDSLERIRLVAKLSKDRKNPDRKGLFACGTLREMALLLYADGAVNANKDKVEIQIPYLKIVEQCGLTPNAPAICFQDQSITYLELERVTNRLANCLKSHGIGKGSLVGIMTLPGPMMLVGMVGILKSGAAYVPVDPSYPIGRIQYIINHSEINILLTEDSLIAQVNDLINDCPGIKNLILLDSKTGSKEAKALGLIEKENWMEYSEASPDYTSSPEDLMVVLYTSGSTGNPKGVMLNHLGYMNRLIWHQKTFDLKLGERVAQKTSCCFDISVWELFWPLMYGGVVCPVRKDIVKNPWELAQWLIDTKINIMHFVPSLFGEFVHALEGEDYSFRDLRWLIFSGEALPMSYINEWIDRHGMTVKLANLYGPTEASIDVTYHIIDKRPGSDGESQIPIGKPIDNVHILNLDENMNVKNEGEIGELWIGGVQLSQGYLKDQQKTSESFKPNPFKEIPGDFLYKTGDLTRVREDGSFEYHGRVDNQVKIRGFRIELGEIETVLSNHTNVNEAAVIVIDDDEGQNQLVACLSGKTTEDSYIKEFIGRTLPYYMIPHRIEWLESLPKNPNGKLDRRAMKELYSSRQDKKDEVFIPLSPAQRWLMSYFDYPYGWTGFTRFLFKQPLDYSAFNTAINILINRHDALRSTLCQKDFNWVQKILPQGEYSNVEYYDASGMTSEQIDEAVKELIDESIKSFEVQKWPLWKIIVLKVSDSVFDIVVAGHHLISDVLTNNLLFKEIWQIYHSILSGEEINLPPAKSYREFVELVESEKSIKHKEYTDYWKDMFPTKEHAFRIPTDFTLGPNNEESANVMEFALNRDETTSVLSKAKKFFDSNAYSILLAPLYRMLGEQYNQSKVVVSHRMHGRNVGGNSAFFGTAGNFAVNFPMSVDVGPDEEWTSLVRRIRDTFETVPMEGISYDVVSEDLPLYMYPDTKLTPVRANYLGNRDLPQLDVFEFSKDGMDRRYSVPEQKRISIIEFFFSIVDGRLNVEIEYSKNLYSADTIKHLGEKYIESLKKLMNFVEEASLTFDMEKTHSSIRRERGVLSDKVVVITGGGRGIGRSIALSMAKEGAKVVIISRSIKQLQQTAAQLQVFGAMPTIISADVSKASDVDRAVDTIIKKYGKIDVLVNNAGITKLAAINDIEPDEWRKIIDVNLFGTYNFCRAVIPYFINNNQGKIINIGSDSSFIGYPLMSAYAASKHAVLGLTKSLAEELKLHNIQVNAICPALVDTDMAPKSLKSRAIPPEKISDIAVFLASPISEYITGEAIKVYGKQDMYWFGSQQTAIFKNLLQGQKNVN